MLREIRTQCNQPEAFLFDPDYIESDSAGVYKIKPGPELRFMEQGVYWENTRIGTAMGRYSLSDFEDSVFFEPDERTGGIRATKAIKVISSSRLELESNKGLPVSDSNNCILTFVYEKDNEE